MILPGKTLPEVDAAELPPETCEVIAGLRNEWAIHPDVASYLARFIVANGYRSVIEFGCGSSSAVFASALAATGGGTLVSVEERPEWCVEAWKKVKKHSSVDAKLIVGRTALTVTKAGAYFGYTTETPIDPMVSPALAFIDAPHGAMGRAGGVHHVLPLMQVGSVIAFDDTSRVRDQKTVIRLLAQYPGLDLVAHCPTIGRGLTLLRMRERISSARFSLVAIIGEAVDLARARDTIRRVRSVNVSEIEQA